MRDISEHRFIGEKSTSIGSENVAQAVSTIEDELDGEISIRIKDKAAWKMLLEEFQARDVAIDFSGSNEDNNVEITRLKRIRLQKKLTQDEVAKAVGIHLTILSKFENRRQNPSKEALQKLADFYGVDYEELAEDLFVHQPMVYLSVR